ncbi:MAG: putative Ig domain-containing protein, partial [Bryobacteraceae bacterium]|nr:putative Ig domain-containing protein [Bryobacteraceae bacterium]
MLPVWAALILFAGSAAAQGVTITDPSPLPDGQTNRLYSPTSGYTFSTSGGSPPITWSQPAGTLPPGISFNAGTLSGTPTIAGVYTFDIRASTPSSGTSTRTFQLTVTQSLKITTTSPLPSGSIGASYTFQMVAIGGAGAPYAFYVSAGALPVGLDMSPAGLITGIPQGPAGTATFSVDVSDSADNTDRAENLQITIQPALQFSGSCPPATSTLPYGPISIPAVATGGVAPYNYSPASPSWVTYNVAGGNFTGTPPSGGSYTVGGPVTDSSGGSATFSCAITVASPLGVSGSCPTNSIQGSPITPFNLTGSGGVSPYTWTVLSPSWLQLGAAEGSFAPFSGTPPGSGTYPVSIRLTDSIGSTAGTFSCSLSVAATLSLSSTCNTTYPFTPISFPVSALGGYTPYTFSASTLTWLSYTGGPTSGSFTGTPPAPGAYSSTFRVTDVNSNTSTRVCSFTVASAMNVTGSCPTGSIAGTPITPFTLTVAGGQGPFTWNVSSPSWLTLGTVSGNTAQFTGTPPAAGTYPVTITVNDSVGSTQQTYNCSIVVGAALSLTGTCPSTASPLGATVTIPVSASGGTGGYTFTTVTPAWLSYNTSGSFFSGTPPGAGTYPVTLRVTDSSAATTTFSCSVTVAAALSPTGSCPTGSVAGSPITPFTLTVAGGQGPFTWSVVSPAWLTRGTVSGNTAQFTGTPPAAGTYPVSITVNDSISSTQQTYTCSIVVGAALSLTGTCPSTASPLGATVTIPVSASGGTGGYTFTTVTPAWLSYNASAGAFTGTPPGPGTYPVTLRVTDSSGATTTFSCSVTVAPALSATGSCPASAVAGSPITPFTLSAAGGQSPYSWSVVSPAWVQLGTATGSTAQFTGTPPAAGTASVSISVTDAISSTAGTFSCSIPVAGALQLTGTCPSTSVPLGSTVSIPVTASGGTGGYTFTTVTPAWLSYNASAGAFTGTPPGPGTYTTTFRVTDSSGATTTFSCSVTVAAALSATGSCPSSAAAGTPITPFTLTAAGGQSPYTWSVVTPSWVQLGAATGSTAQFSGTPPAAGTATVSIRVTDAISSTAGTFSCSIPVSTALQLTGTCPSTSVPLGSTVSIPVTASGGTGGYTFTSVTPTWLSYNASAGAFTGTPPGPGTYTTTFRVTDSSGATATFNCTVTVGAALSATGTCPSGAVAGTPITPFTLTAAGGQSPYTWSVVTPSWVQLGTASGSTAQFSGTPPSAGTASVSIRVTDGIGSTAGTFSCSIPVSGALQLTGTCPTSTSPVGATVSIPVTASGGSGGYTFTSVTPTWLSYNASAGAFTGTPPAAGSYPVTLRVTDSSGAQATFNCTVTVGAALSATGTCPTTGTVGTPITQFTLTAAGGQAPYTWAVSSPT